MVVVLAVGTFPIPGVGIIMLLMIINSAEISFKRIVIIIGVK